MKSRPELNAAIYWLIKVIQRYIISCQSLTHTSLTIYAEICNIVLTLVAIIEIFGWSFCIQTEAIAITYAC